MYIYIQFLKYFYTQLCSSIDKLCTKHSLMCNFPDAIPIIHNSSQQHNNRSIKHIIIIHRAQYNTIALILNVGDNDFCYHSLDNINIYRSRLRLFLCRSVYRRVFFFPDSKTVILRFAKCNI